ncbi:MAG: Asp23/Gls24 family envelope stress response protein [Parachlamydiaceae bacterium]|nr:Asp23/Gls24 family envelope stress response protein [Parachlamydiaceae bacterium]
MDLKKANNKKVDEKKVDTKEFELPETLYVRDIENRVFQGIVLQCLSRLDGISLVEGNFIDSILDRGAVEGVKGIYCEQDSKNQSISIKIEVNICYGYSIPKKAEEIQTLVSDEITKLTDLHVSAVHVVFKSMFLPDQLKKNFGLSEMAPNEITSSVEEEYSDEF